MHPTCFQGESLIIETNLFCLKREGALDLSSGSCINIMVSWALGPCLRSLKLRFLRILRNYGLA